MPASLSPIGWWLVAILLVGVALALGWLLRARRLTRDPARPPGSRGNESTPARLAGPARPAGAEAHGTTVMQPADRATLGRYRIERELGRGAMGAVYLGLDPQNGRQVAIKTMALSREFEGGELAEARMRFFREAEMASRLQHPDIVTVVEAAEDEGLAYIAMEYVAGHDLSRHTVAGGLLPVPVVLRTLVRVALALAYAHTQGVVHRDVKPANVLIDPHCGVVKVTDFGIAHTSDASRTRTGLVLGTPSFMSPEQMTGMRVDGRSDLYSLGVMLFQLLTGELPHRAESMGKLMHQIANETAVDVRTLCPELPEALADIVARALQKQPELRYPDGRQMAADLLAVAQQLEMHAAESAADGAPDSGAPGRSTGFSRTDPRHNAEH